MAVKNQVQLITYPDSLGGDLKNLYQVLSDYFTDIFPGRVHILPPFLSSGDRGFAPLTYLEIEPTFGAWSVDGLFAKASLQYCSIALGAHEAFAASRQGEKVYEPGFRVRFVDTCGSGGCISPRDQRPATPCISSKRR